MQKLFVYVGVMGSVNLKYDQCTASSSNSLSVQVNVEMFST